MRITATDSALKCLFIHNRSLPSADRYTRIERIERDWIMPKVAALTGRTSPLGSRAQWVAALEGLLASEQEGTPAGRYLAEEASREQFTFVVREFALDGLTEAQNFFPIIPRLPIRAQMAVLRVMIDEFGCGNLQQAHSQLYRNLLAELGLPLDSDHYLDCTSDEMYAFLNVFYWLAQRVPDVEYFLGALAYLEASIPAAFTVQVRACERLGIAHGRYYSEHVHIDDFHRKEIQLAIREYETVHALDPTKLWIGALLLSELFGTAFEAAVWRAREEA